MTAAWARTRTLVVAAAVLGGALTAAVTFSSELRFAYERPGLHIAIEVGNALIALLIAYLAFGRLQRTGHISDLLLTASLTMFALTNFLFSALPAATSAAAVDVTFTWTAIGGRVAAACLLAAAALAPTICLRRARRWGWWIVGGCASALAIGWGLAAALGQRLPEGLSPDVPPTDAVLEGHAAVLGTQTLQCALFLIAAVGFTRRAERDEGDVLWRWLAVAAVFAAVGAMNFLLYPSLYSRWVFTGDGFRLVFYGLMLAGALSEITRYWRAAAHAAVLEERRRIARELHDGLAQELAFIVRRTGTLAREGDARAAQVAAASERALDESRRAISALTRPLDDPFAQVLAQTLETVAARAGAKLELGLAADVEVPHDTAVELIRIASEAVTNAGRHASASVVRVDLFRDGDWVLRVRDDGSGFDPARAGAGGGYGIQSMRDRARRIGAGFELTSSKGAGTVIAVRFADAHGLARGPASSTVAVGR